MKINATSGFAGDCRADGIDEAGDECAFVDGFADGGEGVGGFAGLGNGDDEVGRIDDGIAVAELGGLFDFGKDAGEVFDGVFSDEPGIHGGAATDDENAIEIGEFARIEVESGEKRVAAIGIEATAQSVTNGFGLLKDFFKHVVLISALFGGVSGPIDLGRRTGNGAGIERADIEFGSLDVSDVVVVEVDRLTGVLDNGGGVGGDDGAIFSNPKDDGRSAAGHDESAGFGMGHASDAEGSLDFF